MWSACFCLRARSMCPNNANSRASVPFLCCVYAKQTQNRSASIDARSPIEPIRNNSLLVGFIIANLFGCWIGWGGGVAFSNNIIWRIFLSWRNRVVLIVWTFPDVANVFFCPQLDQLVALYLRQYSVIFSLLWVVCDLIFDTFRNRSKLPQAIYFIIVTITSEC